MGLGQNNDISAEARMSKHVFRNCKEAYRGKATARELNLVLFSSLGKHVNEIPNSVYKIGPQVTLSSSSVMG